MPTMRETLSFLGTRAKSYQSVFGESGAYGSAAMKDLASFCFAFETTADPQRDLSLIKQGRREVWLRIQQHLHLQPEELARLYQAVATGE